MIWIAGDINLPNIDWVNIYIKGNYYLSSFCNLILEALSDNCLTQVVNFPTKQNNTLDIFATNRPNLEKCQPISGISDHKAVYVESSIIYNIVATYTPPIRRKVILWSRADLLKS